MKFSALRSFDDEQAWLRPMIVQVAKQLLKEATWGAKLRLFVGAGLSMVDLASDIVMVVVYMHNPNPMVRYCYFCAVSALPTSLQLYREQELLHRVHSGGHDSVLAAEGIAE